MISTGSDVGTTALAGMPGFRPVLAMTLSAVVVSACALSGPATASLEPATVMRLERGGGGGGGGQPVEVFHDRQEGGRLVAAPVDSVWRVLAEVYDRMGIPVARSDRGRSEFGHPGYRARRIEGKRLSRYLNCGRSISGPLADQYSVTLSVLTRLTAAEGGTMVVTTVDGAAKSRESSSGGAVPCRSQASKLELRLVELIVEVLEGGASP